MLLSIIAGGASELLVKNAGEILTGREAARERDIGNGPVGGFGEQEAGFFEAGAAQVIHGGEIGDFFEVADELSDAHVATLRHRIQGPGLTQGAFEFLEEHADGALGTGQTFFKGNFLAAKHLEKADEYFVDEHGQPGTAPRSAGGLKTLDELHKAATRIGGAMPDKLLVLAQEAGEIGQILVA